MAESEEKKGLLVLGIRQGRDVVKIGDNVFVYIQHSGKSYSKICIYAPTNIKIGRMTDQVGELLKDRQDEIETD